MPGDIEDRQAIRGYPCKGRLSLLPFSFLFLTLSLNAAFPLLTALLFLLTAFFLIFLPFLFADMADRLWCWSWNNITGAATGFKFP